MRILSVAAGVLLSILGAFCFIFSSYSFSAIAFPVGIAMCAAGVLVIASWIVSGRENRLPDTVLVEGIILFLFGFVVLNDQVSDSMMTTFFGCAAAVSGATRVSESFYVSRYKPSDWAKVMVFAVLECLFGVTMMMPSIIGAAQPVIAVGTSFIVEGLSLLMFAMYMERKGSREKEQEAASRQAAKAAAAEEKRRERDYLRSLSGEERQRVIAEKKQKKREEVERKKAEKRRQREEERAARRDSLEGTIQFTKEETEKIAKEAERLGFADETERRNTKVVDSKKDKSDRVWPVFKKPEHIPRLRKIKDQLRDDDSPSDDIRLKKAVKLSEIEENEVSVDFDEVKLPDAPIMSEGGEAWQRKEILKEIESTEPKVEEPAKYNPLRLEEIISSPKKNGISDDKAFTQKVSLNWDKLSEANKKKIREKEQK